MPPGQNKHIYARIVREARILGGNDRGLGQQMNSTANHTHFLLNAINNNDFITLTKIADLLKFF